VTGRDPFDYVWWLGARSAGLVAFCLAAASVIVGLSMSASMQRRRYAASKDLHEQLALGSIVAVAVHGAMLFADRWLRPGLLGVLVPFAAPYRPLWTGLGVIAAYLAALLGLTYYARGLIGARRWRKLHRFTPVIYVLAAAHMLGAGSDRGTVGLRLLVLGTAVPIGALLGVRLLDAYRAPPRAPAKAARPVDPRAQPVDMVAR
jgi:methionine sulfoxide reductase heme-binding subunit